MAKVMISLPDELLAALDDEARRRELSRSALLQAAARRELGIVSRQDRAAIIADLDRLSASWDGPLDAGAMIRAERHRDAP